MTGRIPKTAARLSAAILAATALLAIVAGTAGAEVVYNNVPSPLPANFASIGLAATSTSEFGGQVELAGTARKNPEVTVVMSSWTCETGAWFSKDCKTTKNKTFKVPVTIRIYGTGPGELAEPPLAEKTKTVKMQYRPSSNPSLCPGGETWYQESTKECSHGLAFAIGPIKLKSKKMPKNVIVTVAYPPTGPAESLNISVSEPPEKTLSVGKQPVEEWFANSKSSEMYCPGAKDVGKLGPEEGVGCQGVNYQPVIAISAE